MDKWATEEMTWRAFHYCQHLMTSEERAAERCALHQQKAEQEQPTLESWPELVRSADESGRKFPLTEAERNEWRRRSQDYHRAESERLLTPEVATLLENGVEAFRAGVRDRLLREHRAKLLNLCPRCGAITRTPNARQCSKCFCDWH